MLSHFHARRRAEKLPPGVAHADHHRRAAAQQLVHLDVIRGVGLLPRRARWDIRDSRPAARHSSGEGIWAVTTVLEFRGAANQQIQRRGMEDPQQSVPISISMRHEIIALRRLIHGEEILKSQTA